MSNIHTPDSPAVPALLTAAFPRHDGWTAERQRRFCEILSHSGRVDHAVRAVGMSRESAYGLRRRAAGRAFALAWDAALLLARQRMIDDVYEMAFEGSVEQVIQDGVVTAERRRRDPRMLLSVITKLGERGTLGGAPVQLVAQEFEEFLDCMEADVAGQSSQAGSFLKSRAKRAHADDRHLLQTSGKLLTRAPVQPQLSELENE
jgi:hypothetical protein